MNWLRRMAVVRRFMRRWPARAPAARLADPVEMGTAYGLEASLEPIDSDAEHKGKRSTTGHGWLRPR